mgnify:CR=1 FL=1
MTQQNQMPTGFIPCNECSGTSGNTRHFDYVRGQYHNDWCPRCDGDQRLYVGENTANTYWENT